MNFFSLFENGIPEGFGNFRQYFENGNRNFRHHFRNRNRNINPNENEAANVNNSRLYKILGIDNNYYTMCLSCFHKRKYVFDGYDVNCNLGSTPSHIC